MPITIPDALTAALQVALQAKADADASVAADQTTDAALSAVQVKKASTAADRASKGEALTQARVALEALEDSYFQPGTPAPVAPVAALPPGVLARS